MQISVIIVNYNVRYFLEQALGSVRKAVQGLDADIWVVDNNSVDDSVQMVRSRFPEVQLIVNQQNTGFAVANNQAIRASKGRYVLLLNPDTVIEEDTLHKCVAFMDTHPDCGGLGVRLIDGSGRYLPESKRGFPSPWVAFCKTIGLNKLFPQSATFNGYYLGHLDSNQTHEVDVLVGAFMCMRRSALDQVGLLDEAFFMYGEDIDLSYRLKQGGFKNYYLPTTSIIHYKGESTKKGTLNYVRTFYQAMIIFAEKHFDGQQRGLYVSMLKAAIWFRASVTLMRNFLTNFALPIIDSILIFSGLMILKDAWAVYYYRAPDYFRSNVELFNFPLYTLVWVLMMWLSGAYDRPLSLWRTMRGLAVGTLILAAIYGLLNLDYRSSRALLLLGAVWATVAATCTRLVANRLLHGTWSQQNQTERKLAIVGSSSECARVKTLLQAAGVRKNIVGTVSPIGMRGEADLNDISRLAEVVRIYKIDELIFCSKDIAAQEILASMSELGPGINYKIMPEESMSIIGSSSKNEPGELYTIAIRYQLDAPGQRRNKRLFDLLICACLPLVCFIRWAKRTLLGKKQGTNTISNMHLLRCWPSVLTGRSSWVGYAGQHTSGLPKIKPGVFTPLSGLELEHPDETTTQRLNTIYAKDWHIGKDWNAIWGL